MEAAPRFLQGVFAFKGSGFDKPTALDGKLAYTVPSDKRAQLIYLRAGNSSAELIYLLLMRDGKPMRYFPVGAKVERPRGARRHRRHFPRNQARSPAGGAGGCLRQPGDRYRTAGNLRFGNLTSGCVPEDEADAKQKLVVVGNGMAGARAVEEVLAAAATNRFDITMFGDEPYGNYNRILLSNVLSGAQDTSEIFINPLDWYEENDITLHCRRAGGRDRPRGQGRGFRERHPRGVSTSC